MKISCFCLTVCFTARVLAQAASVPVSNVVTVPVLVEERSGQIAYDLSASDFSIRDEGVAQRVMLDDNAHRPLSLVLVIQTGRDVAAQLGEIRRLDDLLGSFLTGPSDQAAVITFDSSAFLLQGFTDRSDAISRSLSSVAAGNSGASLFDAFHKAIKLLRQTEVTNRRVILLISREHDHGSIVSDAGSIIRGLSLEGVSVYSLTGAAARKERLTKLWSLNPLATTANAIHRNAPEALAQLTGGDFYRFSTERDFEDRTTEIATHIHNRYCLSFQPSEPSPGFHSLQVEVHRAGTNVVSARSGYWISTGSVVENSAASQ